jgi:DNA-binding beta-propeller fold protein YncE
LGIAVLLLLTWTGPASAERTLFVANSGSLGGKESITPFTVASDGTLVAHPLHLVGDSPEAVAVTPDARFVYVTTPVPPRVHGYAIGQGGSLTEVPGSPFETGGIITSGIAITPSGDRVLVTNRGTALNNAPDPGSVAVYDLDPATGRLDPVAGSPFGVTGLEDPDGIAIAPAGNRAFVTGDAGGATFDGRLAVLDIDTASGALSQVPGSPFDFDTTQPVPIVISPNGNRLFVGDVHGITGNRISVLSVDQETGAVSPIGGSPFASVGPAPIALALSADGGRLFSGERAPAVGNKGVSVYDVGGGGKLEPVAGSPFDAGGGEVRGVATSPEERVYGAVSAEPGLAAGFSVGLAGALSPLPGSPYMTGDKFVGTFSIAMTPSGTPKPAFIAHPAPPGSAVSFDATGTTVPGGQATRFDWDFGDGSGLADGGPTPAHTYPSPGRYTVNLTVTNDCAGVPLVDGLDFTGQTAHCVGGPRAATSKSVVVADSIAPEVTGLRITRRFARGSKPTAKVAAAPVASAGKGRLRHGAKISYTLSEHARVELVFQKRKGRGKATSTSGTLVRSGSAGRNSVSFSGRIGKRALKPGAYLLTATATDDAGNRSQPQHAAFTIVVPPGQR